jgi:hypothetical protein
MVIDRMFAVKVLHLIRVLPSFLINATIDFSTTDRNTGVGNWNAVYAAE